MRPLNVLLVTRGSAGHVLPLAPFGAVCAAAGHRVLVAAQAQHRANVERTGLSFAPFGEPDPSEWKPFLADFARQDVASAHAVQISDFFGRLDLRAALPGLREIAEAFRPDVIVRDCWEFASTIVAEELGVPLVRVGLGLASMEEETIRLVCGAVDSARADAGLAADPGGDRLRATPFLTMMPEALEDPAAPAPDRVHRFRVGVRASAEALPDWWPGDPRPLIHLTLGSVAPLPHLPYFPVLYRDAIDALSSLPARVLVTVGTARDPADLGALPDNVRVERWVDLDVVAAAAAVIVCHGGYGSVLGSLARGVPLIVLPLFSGDQWGNAAAVARAGAGVALDGDRATRTVLGLPGRDVVDALADAAGRVLSETSHASAAAAVARAIDALAPVDDAVAVLASIASGGR